MNITGTNAEVMPAPVGVPVDLWALPWVTTCGWPVCCTVWQKTLVLLCLWTPNPCREDWNGAGAHTIFHKGYREDGLVEIEKAIDKLL